MKGLFSLKTYNDLVEGNGYSNHTGTDGSKSAGTAFTGFGRYRGSGAAGGERRGVRTFTGAGAGKAVTEFGAYGKPIGKVIVETNTGYQAETEGGATLVGVCCGSQSGHPGAVALGASAA